MRIEYTKINLSQEELIMINVKYEEYTNDYNKRNKEKNFYSLHEFVDWFFGLCQGKYEDKISIPNPDNSVWKNGPSCMDVNNMWTENKHYMPHQIERDGAIIYSDGKFTNGIKHWNDETKQMCREMLERKKNPQFNFG